MGSIADIPTGARGDLGIYNWDCGNCDAAEYFGMPGYFVYCEATDRWSYTGDQPRRFFKFLQRNPFCECELPGMWCADGDFRYTLDVSQRESIERPKNA